GPHGCPDRSQPLPLRGPASPTATGFVRSAITEVAPTCRRHRLGGRGHRLGRLLGVHGRGIGVDGGRPALGCGRLGLTSAQFASTGLRLLIVGTGEVVGTGVAGGVRGGALPLRRPNGGSRRRIRARLVGRGGTIHHCCSVTVTALSEPVSATGGDTPM